MAEHPILSVVIPTHDRIELTNRAINSVFSRRPGGVEVIVVDDCGYKPYEFTGSRNIHGISVTVLRTEVNGGPGLARRFGVERCSGCAVALLDSDDIYENGWIDEVLDILSNRRAATGGTFIAGSVKHGSTALRIAYWLLTRTPKPWRIPFTRLTAVIFNPFYTPSVILSRDICQFSDSLRYCEDYYTNVMALFKAKEIVLLRQRSCSLSRQPGTVQGESANASEMWQGEMSTRRAILQSEDVPAIYKLAVPFGVLYQFIRGALQWIYRRGLTTLKKPIDDSAS